MCGDCAAYNRTAKESGKRPTSFHAWDPACLKRLPEYVSREFPFILTRRSGIDTRLVDNPADAVVCGRGFAAVAKRIREVRLVGRGGMEHFVAVLAENSFLSI